MVYLSADSVSKAFGELVLFEGISFGLEKGQKTALVARNGAGKSTLLKIIMGKELPDKGQVSLNKEASVGFLDQDPVFLPGQTVEDYLFSSDHPSVQTVRAYEHALATGHNADLEKAMIRMDELKLWDFEVKVKQILTALLVPDLAANTDKLSGGQKKRVALSRVLIEEPDLIILDEPTNHLDLDMIEWLEEYLSRSRMTLLLVTHDRYFLDRICDEILELDNGQLFRHKGNYSYYLEQKALREETEAAEVGKARNLMRKELDWVRRQPKARGTKAKYRLDAFEDLKKKASSLRSEDPLQIQTRMSRLGGKVMEMDHVNKAYGEKIILKDFSYVFKRKEKIGIVGNNGVGKSTFLNLLTGREQPDSGVLDKGQTVVFGYYHQQGISLPEDKRVLEVIQEKAEVIQTAGGQMLSASQLLQTFQFPPKKQYAYVSTLSGGEKRRLYLLTILMQNPNFLILDEPTNDLDLLTLTTLENFLENYDGCLIVVSHDRYFMDRTVEHLFVFEGDGKITDFNGTYAEYREWQDMEKDRIEAERLAQEAKKQAAATALPSPTSSEKKKKRSFKEQKEFETLEAEIASLEAQKIRMEADMSSGALTGPQVEQAAVRYAELSNLLDEKMMRWMELDELS